MKRIYSAVHRIMISADADLIDFNEEIERFLFKSYYRAVKSQQMDGS